jgi:2-polyprenyl-3-methyl-5-hydroxy-6-metoxy-1,4-benzoquinol methylase
VKYQCDIDLSNKNMSQTLIIDMVGGNKRVLEVGCAAGAVSQALRERGCRVVGVEIDAELASSAKEYCEEVILGDAEELDLESIIGDRTFDVAIFGDVLEHLKDPLRMLSRTRAWLDTEGYVVASLPNIAHGAVRLSMLQGRFQYTAEGLLDETHLRFFTRDTIREVFHEAGFALVETQRTELGVFETEIPLRREDFSPEVLADIEADPDVTTYQFVTKAVLDNGVAAIGVLHEREQAQRAAMFELERQLAEGREQGAQLRAELEASIANAEALSAQVAELRERLGSVTVALDVASDALSHHEAHWAQIERRLPVRVYQRLKRLLAPR